MCSLKKGVLKSFIFSIGVFFHNDSRIAGLQAKGEGISLTPHYHFHPLHRHLGISRRITAESSPLHICSSRTQTGYLWFPSASHWPLVNFTGKQLCWSLFFKKNVDLKTASEAPIVLTYSSSWCNFNLRTLSETLSCTSLKLFKNAIFLVC